MTCLCYTVLGRTDHGIDFNKKNNCSLKSRIDDLNPSSPFNRSNKAQTSNTSENALIFSLHKITHDRQ